jgi:hypothetical protein
MNPESIANALGNSEGVEVVSSQPAMIEFVGLWQVRGFPFTSLKHYTLERNSGYHVDIHTPPDVLILEYPASRITLVGWRLGLLAEHLRLGQVARVRVVPPRYKPRVRGPQAAAMWIRDFQILPHLRSRP